MPTSVPTSIGQTETPAGMVSVVAAYALFASLWVTISDAAPAWPMADPARRGATKRRVIARLEYGSLGNNPRFLVAKLQGDAVQMSKRLHCDRKQASGRDTQTDR